MRDRTTRTIFIGGEWVKFRPKSTERRAVTVSIRYVDGRKGVILVSSGRVKGAEFTAATKELFARDFTAEPLLYVLVERGADVTAIDVTAEDVRDIAEQDIEVSSKAPNVSVAVLANNTLSYGLARMWQTLVDASGWRTAIFQDRAAAVDWLRTEVAKKTGIAIELE
jgi:hypothetical protein